MARLTPGTVKPDFVPGGIPAIVRADILTALGYASLEVDDSDVGTHLMLANYCECPESRKALYRVVPGISWDLWWHYRREGSTSRQVHVRLAQLAVNDTCVDKRIQAGGVKFMAQFCGVDHRIWKRRYASHYGSLMSWLNFEEAPIFRATYRALFADDI